MNKNLMLLVLGAMFVFGFTAPAFAQEQELKVAPDNLQIDDTVLKTPWSRWEKADFYVGSVWYKLEAEGSLFWNKDRLFLYNPRSLGIGPMFYGDIGNGKTPVNSKYDNKKLVVGVAIKPRRKNWNSTTDIGIGKSSDSGSLEVNNPQGFVDPDGKAWPVVGKSTTNSDSNILYAAQNLSIFKTHGKVLLPKVEFNITYINYLKTTNKEAWEDAINPKESWKKSKDESGGSSLDAEVKLWLANFWIDRNLRVSPGLVGGAGSTVNDESYGKYGVAAELATWDWTILQVSYERRTGDQEGYAAFIWGSYLF